SSTRTPRSVEPLSARGSKLRSTAWSSPCEPSRTARARRAVNAFVQAGGMQCVMNEALSREEFEALLRAQGARYHIHHPFNARMANGDLAPRQIRGWVLNRFYYQTSIPIKDAAMLSNCPDRGVRREWIQRILDHDGHGDDAGGIEAWIQLGEAVGI